MPKTKDRTLIGVAERVDLPEWGVRRLRVKIDTGAKTSALHVDEVEELPGERVRFAVVQHRKKRDERVVVEAPIVRRGRVRSSTGKVQERIFVETRICLGGVEKEIEISLASRQRMIFRMLLGRSALQHDFLVDPSRRYLHGRHTSLRPPPGEVTGEAAAEADAPADDELPRRRRKNTRKQAKTANKNGSKAKKKKAARRARKKTKRGLQKANKRSKKGSKR